MIKCFSCGIPDLAIIIAIVPDMNTTVNNKDIPKITGPGIGSKSKINRRLIKRMHQIGSGRNGSDPVVKGKSGGIEYPQLWQKGIGYY